jgi:hypothetical protein
MERAGVLVVIGAGLSVVPGRGGCVIRRWPGDATARIIARGPAHGKGPLLEGKGGPDDGDRRSGLAKKQ